MIIYMGENVKKKKNNNSLIIYFNFKSISYT